MDAVEERVRAAFAAQAGYCAALGSPFTALVCKVLGDRLDRSTPVGARVLSWPGDPGVLVDNLPLRLAGGLHALVRRGRLPDLAACYPPNPMPEADQLWEAVAAALRDAAADLDPWLDGPPQTNEVARSAVLVCGLLVVAARTGLPLSLSELGCSAGLNLVLDRYGYDLGGLRAGVAKSLLQLAPAWQGEPPPDAPLRIVERRGVDLNPLDVTAPQDRERLIAYLWADQAERIRRVETAISLAAADPPGLDRADAAAWLGRRLASVPAPGLARVVMHSIAMQYFPDIVRASIAATLTEAGARADATAPLAWLRYESDPAYGGKPSLRLRLWPGGGETVLALADAHGRTVEWLGAAKD